MGNVNKNSPCFKAGSVLRAFARETPNKPLANVIRFIDSRLQYFIDWEGSAQEGDADHLSWVWGVESEIRDLNYLKLIPDCVAISVLDLLEQAVDNARIARLKRREKSE